MKFGLTIFGTVETAVPEWESRYGFPVPTRRPSG